MFEKHYRICVLSFQDHRYYSVKTKNNVHFYALATCQHSSCTAFKFVVTEPISALSDSTVKIYLQKEINHDNNEQHRRFYKVDKRAQLSEEQSKHCAAVIKWKKIVKCDEDVLTKGNLNNVPSSIILQKIGSEDRAKNDLDPDYYYFMEKLQKMYRESYGDKEKQVKYLSSLKSIALHLNATGNITTRPKYSDTKMTIYYYGIFVAGEKDISPLEVAEALMSSNTETSITLFLKTLFDNLRMITTKKIQKVETDFSLVLLNSSYTAFH